MTWRVTLSALTVPAVKRLLLLPLLLFALVACGDDDEDEPTDAASDPTEADAATDDGEGDDGGYQRIVADLMTVDYLTALDYDLSRIVGVFERDWFPEDHYLYHELHTDGIVDIGSTYEPNLEQIAALEPDVILLPQDQIDGSEFLDELEAIAPVEQVTTSGSDNPEVRYGGTASFQDWRTTLRAYGEVLGLEDEAEAYIEESEGLLEELRTEHGELIGSITATEAKSTPDYMAINALSAAQEAGVLGSILMSELGFQAPAQQASVTPDDYGTIELSAENIDLLDGDLLFLEVRESATDHEESPLWPTLRVVQSGGVVIVGNHWEYGGAVAARVVIEDIDAALDALAERRS